MGWFVGISTRTPTTSICLTAAPSSRAPDALPHFWTLLKGTPFVNVHPLSRRSRRGPMASARKPGRKSGSPAMSCAGPPESAVPVHGPALGRVVSGEPGLGQGGLDERLMQAHRHSRYLSRGPPRLLLGLRIALPQRGRDHLLDERDLAVHRRPDGPQVPGLNAISAQHRGGGRHLECVLAVCPADSPDQPERLKLGQLLLVDPGCGDEIAPAQRAAALTRAAG